MKKVEAFVLPTNGSLRALPLTDGPLSDACHQCEHSHNRELTLIKEMSEPEYSGDS